jgi:hypothetical protein
MDVCDWMHNLDVIESTSSSARHNVITS